jgi:hypothetical protein
MISLTTSKTTLVLPKTPQGILRLKKENKEEEESSEV